jgi:hypothetical protein
MTVGNRQANMLFDSPIEHLEGKIAGKLKI